MVTTLHNFFIAAPERTLKLLNVNKFQEKNENIYNILLNYPNYICNLIELLIYEIDRSLCKGFLKKNSILLIYRNY